MKIGFEDMTCWYRDFLSRYQASNPEQGLPCERRKQIFDFWL